jgi:two-component system sensor histidine kinase AlgZ
MSNITLIEMDDLFLPSFCEARIVFFAITLAELFAFILVLTPLGKENYHWFYIENYFLLDLAIVSLFIQWIVLLSAAILCLFRSWLSELSSNLWAGLLSYFIILMITGLTSETSWWIQDLIVGIESIYTEQHHAHILKNLSVASFSIIIIFGSIHYKYNINKKILILIAGMILSLVAIFSEISSFLITPHELIAQASQHQLFLLRNLGISAVLSAVMLRYLYVQHHWRKQTIAGAYARVQALQARIRPHFLFNSMNSIACLIRIDPDKAEEAIEDFAELFRASLADVRQRVTFADEVHVCEQYLRMESLRLEERLKVVWNIDNVPEDALIPPLTLQPLIENGVYHGVQLIEEGGTIQITGLFDGKQIKLDVESPMSSDATHKHVGNQIGQQNILQRLRLYFGHAAKMRVEQHASTYCVSLRFPYQNHENPNR